MRLIKLTLENFQGMRAETFRFDGHSATILGDNETGKTTVINAVTWLLFDRASTGEKGYTPKTFDGAGGYLHNLDHAAEARFETDTGRIITLRKVYHEVYKKKKGSPIQEFSGHTVDYFVDGVPTKEKDYLDTVNGFCGGPEMMKMLTLPTYFPEDMGWQDRRRVLLDVCGDITDAEVIASTHDLRELPVILTMPGTENQLYTVDAYKRIAVSKKAEINRQLQTIPARIDEASRAMPDVSGLDKALIDERISGLRKQRDELVGGTRPSEKTEAQTRLAEAEAEMAMAKAEHVKLTNEANKTIYDKIAAVSAERRKTIGLIDDLKATLREKTNSHDRMEKRRNSLAAEYEQAHASQWDPASGSCPTCHRPLPDEEIERMREEFNKNRSARLEEINSVGCKEASKEALSELFKEIQDTQSKIGELSRNVPELDRKIAELEGSLKAQPFTSTAAYADLEKKIATLRQAAEDDIQAAATAASDYRKKIDDIDMQIRQQQGFASQIESAAQQKKRISELEEQERQLAEEYEALEKGIYLCDLFTRSKVSMLTDRINSKFKRVRFRLFREQTNGGIDEDCEVMVPSAQGRLVAFSAANNAGRINAGIEIIGSLAAHYGASMPIFVDNAESVTRLATIPGQIIQMVVSEEDKALRMVFDRREEASA